MMIEDARSSSWKAKAYAVGVAGGALFGLLTAYLYSRAAEEEAKQGDGPPPVPATAIIGMLLSALGLVRQIAESGKPNKK
jgi:H+/Cl- antiporter ClcA